MNNIIRLHFRINYPVLGGDELFLSYWISRDNKKSIEQSVRMTSCGGEYHTADVECVRRSTDSVAFRFSVRNEGAVKEEEQPGRFHHWEKGMCDDVCLECSWNNKNERAYLYSSAFTECVYPFPNKEHKNEAGTVVLSVPEFLVPQGKVLAVTGNQHVLGDWTPSQSLRMVRTGCYSWQVKLVALEMSFPLEYKFILLDEEKDDVLWEDGYNRELPVCDPLEETFIEHELLSLPQKEVKLAGVVVPVFSLRSAQSYGVGDFGDLKKFIALSANAGLHVVQVLPMNDTTRTGCWADSYPYSCISAFALHPMYVDICSLKPLNRKEMSDTFRKKRKILNSLPQLDYEEVNQLKNAYLRAYYEQESAEVFASQAYLAFEKSQHNWLWPYCYFRFLLKHFGTSDFRKWPEFKSYRKGELSLWAKEKHCVDKVRYYAFVQFLLYTQLHNVQNYARSKGVILKGDIPIGVSRDSATVWQNPRYFNSDGQAGAPPDYFSKNGQNWGFPTYCWEQIMADGGQWWRERLGLMASYFDAFRIDHVLGFFRIWEIPCKYVSGVLGHFNPALPYSKDEIQRAGFQDDIQSQIVPSFSEIELEELFSEEEMMTAKERFFRNNGNVWNIRMPYLSQREILKQVSESSLRDGLMKAVTDFLFIPDEKDPLLYHLNIGAKETFAYRRLGNESREAYDRLYDDYFYHRHDDFWAAGARKKLPLVTRATNMLPCAEDLGMLPDCMRDVLNGLNILSLEVESMPKYSSSRFANVLGNPVLSVDTISTHDMQPLRLWWKNNPEPAQYYYTNVLSHTGPAPKLMTGKLCSEVLLRHLNSPSLLCVLAVQDWLSVSEKLRTKNLESEQINHPEMPHFYWRYRMDKTIEELAADKDFKSQIVSLLQKSGRLL